MRKRLGPAWFSALGTHYYYYKSLLVCSPSLPPSLHSFTQSLPFSSTSLPQCLHLFTQSLPVSSNLHPVSPSLFTSLPSLPQSLHLFTQSPPVSSPLYPVSPSLFTSLSSLSQSLHLFTQSPPVSSPLYPVSPSLFTSSPSLSTQSLHPFSPCPFTQSFHPVPSPSLFTSSPSLSQSLHLFTQSLPVSSNLHPVSPILFNQSLSFSSPTTSTRDNRAADSQPLTWRRVAPIPTRTEPGKKTEKEIGSALILSVCTAQKERRKPPGCKQNKLTNQHIKQVDLLTLPGSATLPAITAAAGLSERGRQLRPVQSRQSAA